jgi:hypothetical protein
MCLMQRNNLPPQPYGLMTLVRLLVSCTHCNGHHIFMLAHALCGATFSQVQAAQRPSAPPNAFQPGFLNRQQNGQQQQQQHASAGQPPVAPAGNAGVLAKLQC